MSRIGKKPILLGDKTTASLSGSVLNIKGPLGEVSRSFRSLIEISVSSESITLKPKRNDPFSRAIWGTYASHIRNMVEGVSKNFEKKLQIEGIGFRVEVKGENLVMNMGFSHPVIVAIPKGIVVKAEKDSVLISGIDKDLVGQFAAKVREVKKVEPYKGKGIRYSDEVVRRKQGKKST